ncbi:hypothetical protein CK203_106914 [Vitis vinifera]|uniref:Uncharacterized protein n=1 Tax=Vitis vinifera TaxID=29760 RepID=A0A438C7L7_VITVI|nr:hypothetical protein CK203_106914 [Vitis vinifera]
MAVGSFFFSTPKAADIHIHVKMVAVVGASMEAPMVMTDAIFRTRIWCALMFLPKVHGWYSPYAGKVLETSMPTRFESVAYMVLLKIPWISYGNWDVDPSKVAVVGSLCVDWMSSTHSQKLKALKAIDDSRSEARDLNDTDDSRSSGLQMLRITLGRELKGSRWKRTTLGHELKALDAMNDFGSKLRTLNDMDDSRLEA